LERKNVKISSPQYGLISLAPYSPANLIGLRLPGSEAKFCQGEFGTITIQEFNGRHYSIRYSIFNFLKKMSLLFEEEDSVIKSRLLLKGDIKIKSGRSRELHVKESQYALFHETNNDTIHFDKENEFRLFDTTYSHELITGLISTFPSLKDFVAKPETSKRRPLIHSFASGSMIEIVYDILKCPHDGNLRKLYFENKLNDFLFELLVQSSKTKSRDILLNEQEESAVLIAREIILQDLKMHLTIQEISKQVGLNEYKLKAGFKKKFGLGIFECLLEARMRGAKKLLLETNRPIKDIAGLVGYNHLTNFIAAFRNYCGQTPGQFRAHK
jgi:AraC-like DNA-binding protein